MTPEGRVKAKIKDYLRSIGAYFFMPVQTGYGASTLDILCCINGWFVGIEVKRPGEVPTRRQKICMMEIDQADGIAFYATSVDQVKEALRDVLREPRLNRVIRNDNPA